MGTSEDQAERARVFLDDLFASGEIVGSGAAPKVLDTKNLARTKPGFVDRLIHQEYARDNRTMATFEKRSRRLENVKVL